MSKMKKTLMKGMDKVMLSCDTATYLITRNEYGKISPLEKMQLTMHLAGCKYCRRFADQSKYISAQLQKIRDAENTTVSLSPEQKEKLKKTIKNNTEKPSN